MNTRCINILVKAVLKVIVLKNGVNAGLFLLLLTLCQSCEDFLAIDPPKTQIVSELVFTDDGTARSAMMGIYSTMMKNTGFAGGGAQSITHLTGLSSDEFVSVHGNEAFFTNSLIPETLEVKNYLWDSGYQLIYYANSILAGLNSSAGVTADVRKQLEGEAKFVRAFAHFFLTNLFGDVPISMTIDYRVNNKAFRTSQSEVYQYIISDLIDAQNLLSDSYLPLNPLFAGERVHPTKSAASALLARTYLYMGDWANAEVQSTLVIDNTALFSLVSDLNGVFLANSREAIWQLKPIQPGANTNEADFFLPFTFSLPPNNVSLSTNLVSSFESGDSRRSAWIMTYTIASEVFYLPYKYKARTGTPLTEYSTVLRLAEQYLIRAEARAQLNKMADAISDIDALRFRAKLPTVEQSNPSISKADFLLIVERERRSELFAEWGHRWFDIKRTHRADALLGPLKTPNWHSTDVLYPIPKVERQNNPNLTQNQGY